MASRGRVLRCEWRFANRHYCVWCEAGSSRLPDGADREVGIRTFHPHPNPLPRIKYGAGSEGEGGCWLGFVVGRVSTYACQS